MEDNIDDLIRKGINHALVKMNMQAIVNYHKIRELNDRAGKIVNNLQKVGKELEVNDNVRKLREYSEEHSKDKFD